MKSWKSRGVPGQDLYDALVQAAETLQPKSYMEIGVNGGGSLKTVLKATWRKDMQSRTLKTLILCDIWSADYSGHKFIDHSHIAKILREHRAYESGILDVTWLDGDSKRTVPRLATWPWIDLILVDGDHTHKGALEDLQNCWILLRVGGILIFDDYTHPSYPHLQGTMVDFLSRWADAVVVPEATGAKANCLVLQKQIQEEVKPLPVMKQDVDEALEESHEFPESLAEFKKQYDEAVAATPPWWRKIWRGIYR